MFDADKPITKHEEDLLGRNEFANAIARIIVEQIDSESHVIGLYGKWGSGKTSTVNLIIEDIKQLTTNSPNKPIVVSFSSWGSSSVSDVFAMFMTSIKKSAGRAGKAGEAAKEIAVSLLEYGSHLNSIFPPLGNIAEGTLSLLDKEDSLPEIKNQVAELLKRKKRKLLVVIDDIDRLSDDQIKHVFQFVNVIADFPNVVYLLPFDYEVVATALSGIQGINGAAYMNKVIQIPLYLPEPSPGSLLNLLFNQIGSLVDSEREDYDERRLNEVVWKYISPHMTTPRDVRRLQNIYTFQIGLFSKGLNSVDLLALSSLMAFNPAIYNWIRRSKEIVLGPSYRKKQTEHQTLLNNSLKEAGIAEQRIDGVVDMLTILFPAINGNTTCGSHDHWRERRVCHKEIFEGYFSGRSEETWLSNRNTANALYEGNTNQLKELADTSISQNTLLVFLEEIDCRVDLLSSATLDQLVPLLFYLLGQNTEETEGLFGFVTPNGKIEYIFEKLFEKIGKQSTEAKVLDAISNMNLDALAAFSAFINGEELAHGRLAAESSDEAKQHLSLDGLARVEGAFIDRLKKLRESDSFCFNEKLYMLMYLWSCFDEPDFVEYWNNLIKKDPVNICHLIDAASGKWTSSTGAYGWTFGADPIEKVASKTAIDSMLLSLKESGRFKDMSDRVLEKVISFYHDGFKDLGYSKKSAQECRKHFPEWR